MIEWDWGGGKERREEGGMEKEVGRCCISVVQAKLLVAGGLKPRDVCVLAHYSKQVQQIRTVMRQNMLGEVSEARVPPVCLRPLVCMPPNLCVCALTALVSGVQVQVHRVENVQGKEFRALIISTVRTSATESSSERESGFLTNPKVLCGVLPCDVLFSVACL